MRPNQPIEKKRGQRLLAVLVVALGALAVALYAGACNKEDDPHKESQGAKLAATGSAASSAQPGPAPHQPVNEVLSGGLDKAQLGELYHLSEGSEFVPLCALKLRAAELGQTLTQYFDQYNLIADPPSAANPFGLPIGLTVSADPSRMVGFNCAACHVGRIRANGDTYTVVGAPASFNVRQFYDDLIPWLADVMLKDGARLRKVAGCMLVGSRDKVALNAAPSEADLEAVSSDLHGSMEGSAATSDGANELYAHLDAAADAGSAADKRTQAEDAVASSSPRFKELPKPKRQGLISKLLAEYRKQKSLLRSRIDALDTIRKVGAMPLTKPGPGRVDAFMTALNIMNPKAQLPMTSPVAFPPLWDVSGLKWFHYDDNTNATSQRNMGQAIGVGALFGTPKGHPDQVLGTTLKVDAIDSLEAIVKSIKPPVSPFPSTDKAQLAQGAEVYKKACAQCHEAASPASLPKPPEAALLGTDDQRLKNFAQESGGEPVIKTLSRLLAAVEKASKPKNPDKDPQWQTTGRYGLRLLHGVWATAPYLHNNSVPTLADLLSRAEDRPKKFVIDYSRYDVERVGFATLPQATATAPELDTTQTGNGNQGHTYGVELSADDKHALLSFLRQL